MFEISVLLTRVMLVVIEVFPEPPARLLRLNEEGPKIKRPNFDLFIFSLAKLGRKEETICFI